MRFALAAFLLAVSLPGSALAQPRSSALVQMQRAAWYLPTADGAARLFVTEIGSGPPVVFLHGGPGNDFQYIVEALEPHLAEHRFILFDQRGSLLSPVAPERRDSLTLQKLVDDLELLRTSLGQDKLTLFGHSFGSLLALAYYRAYPERVERLVLTGAFPPATTMKSLVAEMRPRQKALRERPAVLETLKREHLDGPIDSLTPRQRSERTRISGLAAISAIDLTRWRRAAGGGVYYSEAVDSAIGATTPEAFDFRPVITADPEPITIVQGDEDYIDPGAAHWRAFAAAQPHLPIRVQIMARASHNAWIDAPQAFRRALANGLAK